MLPNLEAERPHRTQRVACGPLHMSESTLRTFLSQAFGITDGCEHLPRRASSQGRPDCGLQGAISDMRDVRLGQKDSSGGSSRPSIRGSYPTDVIDSHIRSPKAKCTTGGANILSIMVPDGLSAATSLHVTLNSPPHS